MPNRARVAVVALLLILVTSALFAQTTYYFKGDPADQANKVANDTVSSTIGTATFDTSPPTGTAPVTQIGSQFTNEDYVGNPLGIYWSGPFSGTVSGVLDLKWYWSTQNPETIALGGAVSVSVFADPDYAADRGQPQRLIGRAIVPLTGISATPTLIQSQIPVSGTVSGTLLIQVVPQFSDSGNGINVFYNSTTTPSSFTFHSAPQRVPFPAATPANGLPPRFSLFTPSAAQLASGLGIDANTVMLDYAFDHLGLHRIWGHVKADNEPALRLCEKLGYKLEGTLRAHRLRGTARVDLCVVGMLSEEWRAGHD